MRKAIQLLLAACVLAVLAPACGSSGDSGTPRSASPAVPGTATPQPAASATASSLRDQVHAYAAQMMADIKAAEDRGDVIDGVPVGQSDNPYDYVGISPVFTKLVALGRPAVPAIVAEIEASDHDGLREYLLAAAGAQISGDTPGDGQSWSTGKEWASRFRLDD